MADTLDMILYRYSNGFDNIFQLEHGTHVGSLVLVLAQYMPGMLVVVQPDGALESSLDPTFAAILMSGILIRGFRHTSILECQR
jgi:hypothetical protein